MNLELPIISVVIPTYNNNLHIKECVDSAVNQSYRNLQIIVTDNASTDNTFEICKELAKKDSRIELYQNKQNVGPVLNWKKGIERAKGRYIKILFSDDLLHEKCLEEFINKAMASYDLVFSTAIIGSAPWKGDLHYAIGEVKEISALRFLLQSTYSPFSLPSSPCAYFFNTELYSQVFNLIVNSLSRHEHMMTTGAGIDLLSILLYVKLSGKNISYIDTPMVFFRKHEKSITISNSHMVNELLNKARNIFILNC